MTTQDQPPVPLGPQQSDANDGGKWLIAAIIGMLALFAIPMAIIGAVAVASGDSNGGGVDETVRTTVEVSLQEWSVTGELVAPAGQVTLFITNDGAMDHNLEFRDSGQVSTTIGPGGVTQLDLGVLAPGRYEIFCNLPGHESAGMVAELIVVAGSGDIPEIASHDDHDNIDWDAIDKAMTDSMLAFPQATEGLGNPVLEPEILADGTKRFELTAEIVPWEVEPGVIVDAWAYNGVVPAPQIIVDLGDQVEIVIHNRLPMSTDVHWHGIHTPNDQDGVAPYTQDLIGPGDDYTYAFEATHTAVGMYHPHHHGQMQVVNGMFGVFRIGDHPIPRGITVSGVTIPADLEIARDIPMVINDAGEIGLTLNGKGFPATEPYVLNQGDWANITYYNEGLGSHPMHLHQFPQLIYAKDGIPLDQPFWADTVNIAPGERYSAIFYASDPGTWVWHCHILTHVERETGMFGMVTALIVNPTEGYVAPETEPGRWVLAGDHGL